mmetsp:Transcript_78718/g.156543  ORF Transcript_78718/g.156543 Transcript_78718/m.156543 type:complete len:327 (-) Transcript_78718:422-1402(-)
MPVPPAKGQSPSPKAAQAARAPELHHTVGSSGTLAASGAHRPTPHVSALMSEHHAHAISADTRAHTRAHARAHASILRRMSARALSSLETKLIAILSGAVSMISIALEWSLTIVLLMERMMSPARNPRRFACPSAVTANTTTPGPLSLLPNVMPTSPWPLHRVVVCVGRMPQIWNSIIRSASTASTASRCSLTRLSLMDMITSPTQIPEWAAWPSGSNARTITPIRRVPSLTASVLATVIPTGPCALSSLTKWKHASISAAAFLDAESRRPKERERTMALRAEPSGEPVAEGASPVAFEKELGDRGVAGERGVSNASSSLFTSRIG